MLSLVPRVRFRNISSAVELGGTISGEHGIGYVKSQYMNYALDPATLEIMKGIKRVFDPKGILNPGKMFV